MKRRALALYTALCLLLGLFAAPASPMLVCRSTGEPMTLVAGTEERASCCALARTMAADGTARYALAAPDCCDLRQSPERAELPAVTVAPDAFAAAWAPASPAGFVPPAAPSVSRGPIADESAPRAPPLRSSPPRAPPLLS